MQFIFGVLLLIGLCLAEIDIPEPPKSLDEIAAIKERCEKKGKADIYNRLKVAINETRSCIDSKIDPTKVQEELEEAKKTGSMDEVFAKYCNKRPEFKACAMKTVNVAKECMEETEINALDASIKVIDKVLDFACYRDGDRLAMFVAEGGLTCITERSEQIQNCINSTLKIDISSLSLNSLPSNLPSLKFDQKNCDDLNKVRECVVNDLEKCKDTTPANIVDAFFKFVKKSTCINIKQKRNVNLLRFQRDLDIHAIRMINSTALKDKFAEECKKNGGEEAMNEFWPAIFAVQSCLGQNRIFVTAKDVYVSNMGNCTEEHISKVENCLPKQLKFYPKFIMTIQQSLVEFAYDHLNLNKLTPKDDIVFCLQRIKSVGGLKKNLPSCFQRLLPNESSTITQESLPSKSSLCRHINEVNDCINDFIKGTCATDIAVDRILGNLTEALQRPCKS